MSKRKTETLRETTKGKWATGPVLIPVMAEKKEDKRGRQTGFDKSVGNNTRHIPYICEEAWLRSDGARDVRSQLLLGEQSEPSCSFSFASFFFFP